MVTVKLNNKCTAKSLEAASNRKDENWVHLDQSKLDEETNRDMIAHMVKVAVLVMIEKNMHLTSGVKILAQSGLPLALLFPAKFPLNLGCPKGLKCILCNNKEIKCAPSGVIYKAECVECINK